MSENLLSVIVNAINKQKSQEQWQTEGGKYIPSLVNWLKNRRWGGRDKRQRLHNTERYR